jgi:hypothetical protein
MYLFNQKFLSLFFPVSASTTMDDRLQTMDFGYHILQKGSNSTRQNPTLPDTFYFFHRTNPCNHWLFPKNR